MSATVTRGPLQHSHGAPHNHTLAAELWVDQLPVRWATIGAASGLVMSAAILLGPARPMNLPQAVPAALIVTASAGLSWFLLGYWARWSLRPHLRLSAEAALMAIRNNWLSGGVTLAGVPIVLRRAAIELQLYPFEPPTKFDDFIAAVTAFPVMIFGAYVLSIISHRGLANRIR